MDLQSAGYTIENLLNWQILANLEHMATRKWPIGIALRQEGVGASKIWRACIGKKFDGHPRRRGFTAHAEGAGWLESEIEKHRQLQADHHEEAKRLDFTSEQLADARIALAKLAGRASLLDSALAWLQHIEPTKRTPTVADTIKRVVREKKDENNSGRHIHDLEKRLTSFFYYSKSRHLNELRRVDMHRALKIKMGPPGKKIPPSPAQQEKRLRYASILINYAIEQGWIHSDKNPLNGLKPAKRVMERVGFLNYEQVARLLYVCSEMQPLLIPMLALKIFSGIRNSECFHLTWGEIKSKQIEVLAAFAKTGRHRPVKIHPTLAEWLKNKHGQPQDRIFGINLDTKDREACWLWHFTPVWKTALPEFEKWPQNALRHTFGSHYYARTKSISETAYELGNSEGVVKRHYINAVEDDDCARFWRLIPAIAESIADKTPIRAPGGSVE